MINQARIYVPKERRKSQHSWGHPHSTTTSSSSRTPLLQTLRRKALTSKEKRSRRPCCFLLLPPFPPSSFRLVLQSPTGISPGAPNRLRRARGPVVVARPFEALRLIVLSRQQFFFSPSPRCLINGGASFGWYARAGERFIRISKRRRRQCFEFA